MHFDLDWVRLPEFLIDVGFGLICTYGSRSVGLNIQRAQLPTWLSTHVIHWAQQHIMLGSIVNSDQSGSINYRFGSTPGGFRSFAVNKIMEEHEDSTENDGRNQDLLRLGQTFRFTTQLLFLFLQHPTFVRRLPSKDKQFYELNGVMSLNDVTNNRIFSIIYFI